MKINMNLYARLICPAYDLAWITGGHCLLWPKKPCIVITGIEERGYICLCVFLRYRERVPLSVSVSFLESECLPSLRCLHLCKGCHFFLSPFLAATDAISGLRAVIFPFLLLLSHLSLATKTAHVSFLPSSFFVHLSFFFSLPFHHLAAYMSVCQSGFLPVCLSVCLSVCLFTCE